MAKRLTYKERVEAKHSEAFSCYHHAIAEWIIKEKPEGSYLGTGDTESAAWRSAWRNLKGRK